MHNLDCGTNPGLDSALIPGKHITHPSSRLVPMVWLRRPIDLKAKEIETCMGID